MTFPHDFVAWVVRGTTKSVTPKSIGAHHVLAIIEDYGCRVGGVLELYVPESPMVREQRVTDMVEVLRATGVIAGEPLFQNTDRVHDKVRSLKPDLFDDEPPFFRIFRIREERLRSLIETLDRR